MYRYLCIYVHEEEEMASVSRRRLYAPAAFVLISVSRTISEARHRRGPAPGADPVRLRDGMISANVSFVGISEGLVWPHAASHVTMIS